VAGTGVATAAAVYNSAVFASDGVLAPTPMPWDFDGYMTTYDAGAIRRGHQVYSQVCASCHGLRAIAYRNLVGVCYSEEEAKAMAEDVEFADGPNDEGEMFERPGKLSDYFPSPYPNEEAARFANNGAYPPDLSLITKARVGGADYVFALLTGYKDVPAGLQPRDTQYYNPYFPGGWIGMPQPINEGAVEYEDGTSPTVTQMAKDVCVFLTWAAEPEADERKLMGFKMMSALTVLCGFTWWYKRRTWSVIKNRRLVIV
jgi:ubiquinol-cytochrome c reductase cytochrome c1 subunit